MTADHATPVDTVMTKAGTTMGTAATRRSPANKTYDELAQAVIRSTGRDDVPLRPLINKRNGWIYGMIQETTDTVAWALRMGTRLFTGTATTAEQARTHLHTKAVTLVVKDMALAIHDIDHDDLRRQLTADESLVAACCTELICLAGKPDCVIITVKPFDPIVPILIVPCPRHPMR